MDDAIDAITTHLSIGPYHGWSEDQCRYVIIVNRIERRKRTSLEPGSPNQLWWHSGLGWESYPSCHLVSAPWHNQWLFAGHHSRRRSDWAMLWGRKTAVFPHIATFYCCHSWTWNAPSHCHQSLSGTNSWTPWHLLPLKSIVLLFSRIHILWCTSVRCSHALFCLLAHLKIYTNNVWIYGCMYVRVEAQQLTIDSVARWSRTQSDWCGWVFGKGLDLKGNARTGVWANEYWELTIKMQNPVAASSHWKLFLRFLHGHRLTVVFQSG